MQHQALRVSVLPGEGVVARDGETVLVGEAVGADQEALLDALLSLRSHGDARLRETARLLCEQAEPTGLALAVFTRSTAGASVLLAGSARVRLARSDGATWTLGGEEAVTYVDRRLPSDCVDLQLTVAGSPAEPSRRSNLTGGVVGGSGAMLRFTEEPVSGDPIPRPPTHPEPPPVTPHPEPVVVEPAQIVGHEPPTELLFVQGPSGKAPVPRETPPFEAIDLFAPSDGAEVSGDLTAGLHADEPGDVADADVLVQGIMCSRGHFNRPSSRFCSLCGISMVHQTHNLVQGVRPPLGVIVLDDGAVYPLTRDLVLGREPGAADESRADAALPLTLDDPELAMSRVHARVVLDGWEVRIEDAGSSNGTFVAGPQEVGWTRLGAGVPTTILPGTRVSLGGRTLTFESHQRD